MILVRNIEEATGPSLLAIGKMVDCVHLGWHELEAVSDALICVATPLTHHDSCIELHSPIKAHLTHDVSHQANSDDVVTIYGEDHDTMIMKRRESFES